MNKKIKVLIEMDVDMIPEDEILAMDFSDEETDISEGFTSEEYQNEELIHGVSDMFSSLIDYETQAELLAGSGHLFWFPNIEVVNVSISDS